MQHEQEEHPSLQHASDPLAIALSIHPFRPICPSPFFCLTQSHSSPSSFTLSDIPIPTLFHPVQRHVVTMAFPFSSFFHRAIAGLLLPLPNLPNLPHLAQHSMPLASATFANECSSDTLEIDQHSSACVRMTYMNDMVSLGRVLAVK